MTSSSCIVHYSQESESFDRGIFMPKKESFTKNRQKNKGKSSARELLTTRRRDPVRTNHKSSDTDRLHSTVVTVVVGQNRRIFAVHQDVLCISPFFESTSFTHFEEKSPKVITLPDEEPEIFSSILEYLYKGDYHPRLLYNEKRNTWSLDELDKSGNKHQVQTINHYKYGRLLKDTVIYCQAEEYGLEKLKKIALKKQVMQSAIECNTILNSARYVYSYTSETDYKLKKFYLALIIRNRDVFKLSTSMQMEFYTGASQLFYDLFVAMSNRIDDLENMS